MKSLETVRNPFRSSVVADPWHALENDVPEIHLKAFGACLRAIGAVKIRARTTSVLIHGEPGSGKTHLLARLRAHLAVNSTENLRTVFISTRLQTGARTIWRHLQRQLATDLLRRGNGGKTQLERIFLHRLTEIGLAKSDLYRWLNGERTASYSVDDLSREFDEVFDRVDPAWKIGRNLRVALENLLLGKRRRDASAWLLGDALPESALEAIGIASPEEDDDDREINARQIVIALTGLSGANAPVVFCFDQIEALQSHQSDTASIFAFGKMISDLHASTSNALIVFCVQTAFVDELRKHVRRTDLDRIGEFAKEALNPLMWNEARNLIISRFKSLPELSNLRPANAGALWPLDEGEIKNFVGGIGCVARALISKCAEVFDGQIGRRSGDLGRPDDFLDLTLQQRLDRALAGNRPEQTDDILHHALPMLLHLTGISCGQNSQDLGRDIDYAAVINGKRIALSLCNQNTKSLWRRFDRLSGQFDGSKAEKLVLLRDARNPISKNSTGTLQRREDLISRGARWVTLTAEMMAALDALRELLSDAKAGDLAWNGETMATATVEQWLVKNLNADLPQLAGLVEEVAGDSAVTLSDISLSEQLAELLRVHHLISVEDAACLLRHESDAIAECAERYQERFGVLSGPPIVLFQLTNEITTSNGEAQPWL